VADPGHPGLKAFKRFVVVVMVDVNL